jgi:hypothetical protein
MYACMHAFVCVFVCVCVCLCVCLSVCVCLCACARVVRYGARWSTVCVIFFEENLQKKTT